ncbi:MAG: hypothetical protein KF704_07585 [Crocinitomicaceae bacterium]|nr:hypothetical protein [Crocinitomicaceae bacterium]NGF75943.1 hypothetical protein [Fluviicola sp. SGL-29]
MNFRYFLFLFLFLFGWSDAFAQEASKKVEIAVFEGTVVAGYVDRGAYLNFLGPNISFTKGKHKVVLGMLPSLRLKEDTSTPKNAPVTPNLGGGITYICKKIAFQVPFYYNAKTASRNGRWTIGVGIGYKFK